MTDADKEYVDLTITTPDGPKTITTTAHHPFYNATTHSWADADTLVFGDELNTPSNDRTTIQAARHYTATLRIYNLTIDTTHTYYVMAGNTPILVHNANGCGPGLKIDDTQFGNKWGKHASDYGLEPSNPAHRAQFLERMLGVVNGSHEVRFDPISKNGPSDFIMYRQGADLLITKADGTFVSMYPGGNTSTWFASAKPRPCACPG